MDETGLYQPDPEARPILVERANETSCDTNYIPLSNGWTIALWSCLNPAGEKVTLVYPINPDGDSVDEHCFEIPR